MSNEPIQDYIVLGVPDDASVEDPVLLEKLNAMADYTVMSQYRRKRPRAILMDRIDWLITSDWHNVERFQPAHECPTCRAGNDQALAYLKEFPRKRLALGNLRYTEVW